MVQIAQSEMHLLVLICTNPNHPEVARLIANLGDDAKAIALLVLKQLNLQQAKNPAEREKLPAFPRAVTTDAVRLTEVRAAAAEFVKMAAGRRRENEIRVGRMAVA